MKPHCGWYVAAWILAMTGCAAKSGETRTKLLAGKVIEVPVKTYVPIDAALLERCDWPKAAPLRDVVEVARKRRACLEAYERQFDTIGKVQGQAAPEGE